MGVSARQRLRLSSLESFPVGLAADENKPVLDIESVGPFPSITVTGATPGRPFRTSWVISSQAFVLATSAAKESGALTKNANDTTIHLVNLFIDISVFLPNDLYFLCCLKKIYDVIISRIPYFTGKNHGLCENY